MSFDYFSTSNSSHGYRDLFSREHGRIRLGKGIGSGLYKVDIRHNDDAAGIDGSNDHLPGRANKARVHQVSTRCFQHMALKHTWQLPGLVQLGQCPPFLHLIASGHLLNRLSLRPKLRP